MPLNNVIYVIEAILLAGFTLGAAFLSLAIFQHFRKIGSTKNFIVANTERIKKFKEDGGVHSWINIAVRMPNGQITETHVCQHTGYCPSIEGFVELEEVKEILRQRKVAKEFEEYKRKKLLAWGEEYLVDDMKELYAKIIGLKQSFHVEKIEKELENGKS